MLASGVSVQVQVQVQGREESLFCSTILLILFILSSLLFRIREKIIDRINKMNRIEKTQERALL